MGNRRDIWVYAGIWVLVSGLVVGLSVWREGNQREVEVGRKTVERIDSDAFDRDQVSSSVDMPVFFHSGLSGTITNFSKAEIVDKAGEAPSPLGFNLGVSIVDKDDPRHNEWRELYDQAARLQTEGKEKEVIPVAERMLALAEEIYGPDHERTLVSVTWLGFFYMLEGRYEEAEPLLVRSLEGYERMLGPSHPITLTYINNLAQLYQAQGRYDEAEPLYVRALEARERVLGTGHPDTLISVNNLATLYDDQGRYAEAERLYARALKAFDENLEGVEITEDDLLSNSSEQARVVLSAYERTLRDREQGRDGEAMRTAAFHLSQRFHTSSAAEALSAASERLRLSESRTKVLVDHQVDVARRIRIKRKSRDALLIAPQIDGASIGLLEEEIAVLQQELVGILSELEADQEGAGFAELTGLTIVDEATVHSLLKGQEAMLFFSSAGQADQYVVFLNTRTKSAVISLDADRNEVNKLVQSLRRGLQLPYTIDPATGERRASSNPDDLPDFDLETGAKLYEILFGPLQEHLRGINKLIIVADGPLQSLPFSVLVSNAGGADQARFRRYQSTYYLADDYAVAVYPSVSSLRTLRADTPRSRGARPFVGYGDPVMKPDASTAFVTSAPQEEDPMKRKITALGGAGDWSKLEDLPEISALGSMLKTIGAELGADVQEIHTRGYAQESDLRYWNEVKRLKNYKIIAFATHALVSNELESLDLKEPALVLSRPLLNEGEEPISTNDGLFRASDVIGLDLDADMVILAACNTAASDGSTGADPLSGLAKAFMLSGARSLLVSHWQADADSTAELIPNMVKHAETQGFARALQQAKIEMRQNASTSTDTLHYAHPAIWGTFTLIGEAE